MYCRGECFQKAMLILQICADQAEVKVVYNSLQLNLAQECYLTVAGVCYLTAAGMATEFYKAVKNLYLLADAILCVSLKH